MVLIIKRNETIASDKRNYQKRSLIYRLEEPPHSCPPSAFDRRSRFSSYNHSCEPLAFGLYQIAWYVDRKDAYSSHSPTRFHKVVREAAARRFCKKHGLTFNW